MRERVKRNDKKFSVAQLICPPPDLDERYTVIPYNF